MSRKPLGLPGGCKALFYAVKKYWINVLFMLKCNPEKELKVKKDKKSIAEVLDNNNCHIIEVDGKIYYVCLEE